MLCKFHKVTLLANSDFYLNDSDWILSLLNKN